MSVWMRSRMEMKERALTGRNKAGA
jgi:hypothetical protein